MNMDIDSRSFRSKRILRGTQEIPAIALQRTSQVSYGGAYRSRRLHQAGASQIAMLRDCIVRYASDLGRAASFACFLDQYGDVEKILTLQLGSLNDVAFYERDVVELCFERKMDSVVIAFHVPQAPPLCPPAIVERLGRFARTLAFIEMSMPYVLWSAAGGMQVLNTQVDILRSGSTSK